MHSWKFCIHSQTYVCCYITMTEGDALCLSYSFTLFPSHPQVSRCSHISGKGTLTSVCVLKTIALPHTGPNTELGLCPSHTDDGLISHSPSYSQLAKLTRVESVLLHFSSPNTNPWHCFLALTFSLLPHSHFGNSH